MKRYVGLRVASAYLATFCCLTTLFWGVDAYGQTNRGGAQTAVVGEADVAQSMGVGLKSRFASGATPIQLSRTSIVPGTPMTVNSTMNNIMASGSSSSFGGILARYDTSNFGKFFGSGTLAPRATSARVNALDSLTQADNEVENIETEKMYPPRLLLDFNQYHIRSLATDESKKELLVQVENVVSRFNFDPAEEQIVLSGAGSTVFLRGKVKSGHLSRLVESVVGMQAGVEEVVNELEIVEPNADDRTSSRGVDVFGRKID